MDLPCQILPGNKNPAEGLPVRTVEHLTGETRWGRRVSVMQPRSAAFVLFPRVTNCGRSIKTRWRASWRKSFWPARHSPVADWPLLAIFPTKTPKLKIIALALALLLASAALHLFTTLLVAQESMPEPLEL
jgi:hypothetical protein